MSHMIMAIHPVSHVQVPIYSVSHVSTDSYNHVYSVSIPHNHVYPFSVTCPSAYSSVPPVQVPRTINQSHHVLVSHVQVPYTFKRPTIMHIHSVSLIVSHNHAYSVSIPHIQVHHTSKRIA